VTKIKNVKERFLHLWRTGGREAREGVGRDRNGKGWMGRGREGQRGGGSTLCNGKKDRESGGMARLGYLSRGPQDSSYATGEKGNAVGRVRLSVTIHSNRLTVKKGKGTQFNDSVY